MVAGVVQHQFIETAALYLVGVIHALDQAVGEDIVEPAAAVATDEFTAILADKARIIHFVPDADATQYAIAGGQQRLADLKAGESFFFDQAYTQSGFGEQHAGGASRRPCADDDDIEQPFIGERLIDELLIENPVGFLLHSRYSPCWKLCPSLA